MPPASFRSKYVDYDHEEYKSAKVELRLNSNVTSAQHRQTDLIRISPQLTIPVRKSIEMNKEVYDDPNCKKIVRNGIFSHWIWIDRPLGLARSSAPNYDKRQGDKSQNVTREVARYLREYQFDTVISLNHIELDNDQKNLLRDNGVAFYHHILVPDFQSPRKDELIRAFELMQNKRWLVWCGFGAGRTGTMVTAWEILSGRKNKATAIDDSTAETAQQEAVLKSLPNPHLPTFVCGLCNALREYKRSQTNGLSFGLGRTATLLGLRKASAGSQNIANALESMLLRKLGVNVATYGAKGIKEADLPPLTRQGIDDRDTFRNIRQFVEWAADKNNDAGFFGRQPEFAPVIASGKAGATMKGLLLSALKTVDGY